MLGHTVRITPGACAIQYPMTFNPASVAPICAPFWNTTRSTGELVESASMISRR